MKRKIIVILLLIGTISSLLLMPHDNNIRKKTLKVTTKVDKVSKEEYQDSISELRKKYNNDDIISKLVINDIGIDTVITKSTDNKHYLKYDAYNNESMYGNPYVDYRNNNNLDEERQINIYSHNFYTKEYNEYAPFSKLEKYTSKEIFESSKEIYLLTDENIIKYEVYAIKIIKDNNEHMILEARDDIKWQNHLNLLLQDTMYCKEGCHLNAEDKLLILQTCYYNPKNSYLLIIAKRIN